MHLKSLCFCIIIVFAIQVDTHTQAQTYPWHNTTLNETNTLISRISPPRNFKRLPATRGSFAKWLRGLPLKPANSPVMLHNGKKKINQSAHLHVVDIDVGKRDLQQCADAIMRLRAEYLYSQKRYQQIAFNYTNGKRVRYTSWTRNRSYKKFRKYMTSIFVYAGTYSLSKELKPVKLADMKIGDIFIKGGFPGHAVLVVDMVQNPQTQEKKYMLLQSFMPAQDMHILRNPKAFNSPWYTLKEVPQVVTPEWTFKPSALKRFH